MVEYECGLGSRHRIGPSGICNKCAARDCTNPIEEVNVNILGFGAKKERLWSDSDKPIEERILRDYSCVIYCKGFIE